MNDNHSACLYYYYTLKPKKKLLSMIETFYYFTFIRIYYEREREREMEINSLGIISGYLTNRKKILIIIFPTWNIFSPSHVNSNNSSNYPIIQSPMRINLNQLFSSLLLLYGTYCCYEFHFIVNH